MSRMREYPAGSSPPKATLSTAYHESAHAVIARAIRYSRVDRIELDVARLASGLTTFARSKHHPAVVFYDGWLTTTPFSVAALKIWTAEPNKARYVKRYRKLIVVLLAGVAADRRRQKRGSKARMPGNAGDMQEALRIATILHGGNFFDATMLVAECESDARALVLQHWAAVERVAIALWKRKRLSGKRFEKLFAQN